LCVCLVLVCKLDENFAYFQLGLHLVTPYESITLTQHTFHKDSIESYAL
jgi:hypothetical protein